MALRFLADHCVSNSIVRTLRGAGHEVLRLREVLPVESPDRVVIAKAQEIDAILLSMNGDFADIVTYPPSQYQGIVALQMRNHAEVLERLLARLIDYLGHSPVQSTTVANYSWSKSIAYAYASEDPGEVRLNSCSPLTDYRLLITDYFPAA